MLDDLLDIGYHNNKMIWTKMIILNKMFDDSSRHGVEEQARRKTKLVDRLSEVASSSSSSSSSHQTKRS
jgi:hypothetical protein